MKPAVSGSMKIPAQNGVSSKLEPCNGSQIPCSQMMSMNIRPPRPIADKNVARVPKVKALIFSSDSRNIGSATCVSMMMKATSKPTPAASIEITGVLVHPIGCPFAGWIPHVIPIMIRINPAAKVRFPAQSILA